MTKSAADMWLRPVCLAVFGAAAVSVLVSGKLSGQALERPQSSLELIDPKALRVCADPHNMPFSTEKGEGFENKVAELLAGKLGRDLSYTWYPQAPGFVRNTLAAHKCDVIMGAPQGDDMVQVQSLLPHGLRARVQAGSGSRRRRYFGRSTSQR